ncbi:MAG: ADP-ribosylglycohydrolase family protein [Anaerolineae bacterium]
MNSTERTHDRIIGSVVGLAVGDALGAPVEGWSAREISRRFGTLRDYVDTGRLPGAYTDDAQQALCILDVLLEEGTFDPEALARKFVELAQPVEGVRGRYLGAFRGTGPGFRDSVRALRQGVSWQESGTLSAGNGTAMRVGPLGAFYHAGRFVEFRSAIFKSAWITHTDPRALAGAFMIAYSVVHAINQGDQFRPDRYLRELYTAVQDAEKAIRRRYWHPDLGVNRESCLHTSGAIRRIGGWLKRDTSEAIEAISRFAQHRTSLPTHALSSFVLGSGIVAVYLFARYFEDLEEALVIAVNLGGDADSIGAMVGTMAGALHGYSAIPTRWGEGLRNYDAIYARAEALARGEGMPAGAPGLREMEMALTVEEASR